MWAEAHVWHKTYVNIETYGRPSAVENYFKLPKVVQEFSLAPIESASYTLPGPRLCSGKYCLPVKRTGSVLSRRSPQQTIYVAPLVAYQRFFLSPLLV